jgi:hypothetical protein
VDNSLSQLAFEASLRALDKQEQLLNEIRARTGLLVAASSLAASFLGGPALDEADAVLAVSALAAFAASIGLSIYVLIPRKDMIFSLSGLALYEELFPFRDDMSESQRRLSYQLHRFWVENDEKMIRLIRAFRWAAIGLAVEIGLLLTSRADTLV